MLLVIFQVFVIDILTLHLTVFLFFLKKMSWHKNYICRKKNTTTKITTKIHIASAATAPPPILTSTAGIIDTSCN